MREYLANTTGYKTVEITLKNSRGQEINQIEIIKKEYEENIDKENLEAAFKVLFPSGKLTIKRTWIDDLVEMEKK